MAAKHVHKPINKLVRKAPWRLRAIIEGDPLDWDDNECPGCAKLALRHRARLGKKEAKA